jgi:benzodiazapine receptor
MNNLRPSHGFLVFPLVISQIINFILPVSYPKRTFIQPPSYVFGIVWTAIYLLLGIVLYRMGKIETLSITVIVYTLNLLINLSWSHIVFGLNFYNYGIFSILLMIMLNFVLIVLIDDKVSKLCLIPYTIWLMFALLLQIELVRSSKYPNLQIKIS